MQQPRIGRVDLTVSDLDRSTRFYLDVIGLELLHRGEAAVLLGVGDRELLRLVELPGARPAPRTTGLYHFALLLPSRRDLALSLAYLHQTNAPISGYADHAVSEAIYLTDPDGHGIEIYRDRPREEWEFINETLRMTVDPLDVRGILAELPPSPSWTGLPPETMMGHIHLQVKDIAHTEQFYTELLGFDLMIRYGPSATFMATDGYHHHIGGNTWAGAGAPPPPPTAARLLSYEILLDTPASRDTIAARLAAAGVEVSHDGNALVTTDPSHITVRLVLRQ